MVACLGSVLLILVDAQKIPNANLEKLAGRLLVSAFLTLVDALFKLNVLLERSATSTLDSASLTLILNAKMTKDAHQDKFVDPMFV